MASFALGALAFRAASLAPPVGVTDAPVRAAAPRMQLLISGQGNDGFDSSKFNARDPVRAPPLPPDRVPQDKFLACL